jgi:hypothetical protein
MGQHKEVPLRPMRGLPEYSKLVLYAVAPGTDTTTLPDFLAIDSDSGGEFAIAGHIYGNRDFIDAA